MATSADVLCGLCESQDITKHAEHWCPECEEGLCSDCFKYHKIAKASKNHQVISVENFKKLPKSISSIGHNCQKHDKLYQNYCKQHESLCCPVCIATDHQQCVGLLVIDDIIKTAKSSSMLESIEESVQFLKRTLQLLIDEREQNLEKNKIHREHFLDSIKNVRKRINAHLDMLEQQIMSDTSVAEKKIKGQFEIMSKELNEKLRAVEELEKDVIAVKEFASDMQTCLGSMSLKTKVEEEHNCIKSLVEGEKLKQFLLKCSIDERILADILSLKTLGSVYTEKLPSSIDMNTMSKTRAQTMSKPILKSIDDINLTLKCKIQLPATKTFYGITGCTIQPDGKIILVDRYNNKLLIFNEMGVFKREINLSNLLPTDVTSVDDKTICVSYCDGNRLELINTDSFKTIPYITTTGSPCGITSKGGTLYWYEEDKGIQMKQVLSNDITTLVKPNDDEYWSYVSVHIDRIYQTNEFAKTVSCFHFNGDKIWEFKDELMIKQPLGIAIDNALNVYVADYSKGVFIVSHDGKNCRHILGANDGKYQPYALCFDRIRNILVVSNLNGPVFVYSLS